MIQAEPLVCVCAWCGTPFVARRSGGSHQRFCRVGCRNAFWTAARRWVMAAVDAGVLTADALKAHRSSVHAVIGPSYGRDEVKSQNAQAVMAISPTARP